MVKAIMKVASFVNDNTSNKLTRALLTDLATHHWVLTREFIVLGTQKGWEDDEFVEQCIAVFAAGNSTKYTLESGFNHLKDSLRQARVFGRYIELLITEGVHHLVGIRMVFYPTAMIMLVYKPNPSNYIDISVINPSVKLVVKCYNPPSHSILVVPQFVNVALVWTCLTIGPILIGTSRYSLLITIWIHLVI